MNVKPGDLACCVRSDYPSLIGAIVTIASAAESFGGIPHWESKEKIAHPESGRPVAWADMSMQPLRGAPAKTKPEQVSA
jgi:hypothetical protein